MELARSSSDPDAQRWIASLANNMAWARHDAGDYEEALELFRSPSWNERARTTRSGRGSPGGASRGACARSAVPTTHSRSSASLAAELEAVGEIDGYVTEEIAECLLTLGRKDEARPVFARAYAELSADDELLIARARATRAPPHAGRDLQRRPSGGSRSC